MRQSPVLFLAAVRREADYWARAWGFGRSDWKWVGREEHVMGLTNPDDAIVFVCGSQPLLERTVEYLRTHGYETFVDAHDLDTNHEPRTALDLLGDLRPEPRPWTSRPSTSASSGRGYGGSSSWDFFSV